MPTKQVFDQIYQQPRSVAPGALAGKNPAYKAAAVIPTLEEWKRVSSNARFKIMDRRGSPEIQAIDRTIANFKSLEAAGANTARLWEAAVELLEAVEVYLAVPRGAKHKRQECVAMLRLQVLRVVTNLRWQKVKEVGATKPGMKLMVEHVWSEMHSPGHARVGHGAGLDPDPWLEGSPEATEKYLFEYLRRVRAQDPKPDNVLYIEDSERWKYQIVFSEQGLATERPAEMGGLLLAENAQPITTNTPDNLSTAAYAVDENGIFYTETSAHGGGTINHCSFLGGRPVMCAGNIGIRSGYVGYIDNGSGHYRPSLQNLLKCLKVLQDHMMPMIFETVLVRNHAGSNPNAVYLAGKFLATRGHCLPVGYYKSMSFNSHYRDDLIEFQSPDEVRAFMEEQDVTRERDKISREVRALRERLEMGRGNGKATVKTDADREIIKRALLSSVFPDVEKDMLKANYEDDPAMKLWVKMKLGPKPVMGRRLPVPPTQSGVKAVAQRNVFK